MGKKKLLDQVSDVIRLKHYSIRTKEVWVAASRCYPESGLECHRVSVSLGGEERFWRDTGSEWSALVYPWRKR